MRDIINLALANILLPASFYFFIIYLLATIEAFQNEPLMERLKKNFPQKYKKVRLNLWKKSILEGIKPFGFSILWFLIFIVCINLGLFRYFILNIF